MYYSAGVVVVNSEVVGWAPGIVLDLCLFEAIISDRNFTVLEKDKQFVGTVRVTSTRVIAKPVIKTQRSSALFRDLFFLIFVPCITLTWDRCYNLINVFAKNLDRIWRFFTAISAIYVGRYVGDHDNCFSIQTQFFFAEICQPAQHPLLFHNASHHIGAVALSCSHFCQKHATQYVHTNSARVRFIEEKTMS
jgi:hypothetical protein